jgi:hypothetical protein
MLAVGAACAPPDQVYVGPDEPPRREPFVPPAPPPEPQRRRRLSEADVDALVAAQERRDRRAKRNLATRTPGGAE